jgi:hypothetical protein
MTYIGRILATAMVAASLLDTTGLGQDAAAARTDTNTGAAIRPFKVHVPEADVADMRRRLAATRWPDKETVAVHRRAESSVPILPLEEQPGK